MSCFAHIREALCALRGFCLKGAGGGMGPKICRAVATGHATIDCTNDAENVAPRALT
jgi:hypothetical protein